MRITSDQIAVEIGTKPGTSVRQEVRHEAFIITSDLQMIQQVRVVCLADDGTTSKADEIRDMGLSPARQADALNTFQDRLVNAQTAGAFVDRTGKVVNPMADGFDPETAIAQKAFFQGITLGDLEKMGAKVGKTATLAGLMYFMIGAEMLNMDGREQI